MDHSLFVLAMAAAVAALSGCASDNPASSVVIGPATTAQAAEAQAATLAQQAGTTQGENTSPSSSAPGVAATPAGLAAPATSAAAAAAMPAPATAAATSAQSAPLAPSASSATAAPPAAAFATRHAWYQAAHFSDLPGWSTDDLGGSLDAFKRSCGVLGTRTGWAAPCAAARGIDAGNAAAIRRFFETNFDVYQIRNTDRSSDGTMTGYYEPLLNGSRQPGGAYVYPVYGVPDDMLYLDSRRLGGAARGSITAARLEGRTVIPLPGVTPGSAKGVYTLDLRDSVPDIRDKKLRLRLDGERIVPYYTRAEIERGAAHAPVLAWVDDPVLLYSMQMQGSGKIRMRDGTIRRVAYAEQNGQPFVPPVAHAGASGRKLKVRGVDMDIDVADDDNAAPGLIADANGPQGSPGTQSAQDSNASSTGANDSEDDQPVSPLLRGFKLANATPVASGAARPAVANTQPPGADAQPKHTFATSDPSYVFFRPIPDSPNGPIGALGVPLSAGRSVAVDPRTTPLGSPVFVATRDDPQTPGAVNRLMMAQDSGGAIQGAVRADYFYGFGQSAQSEASRTKERLRMWLLLPKGLHVAAQETATKTRGLSNQSNADCLVADPQLCVDDDGGSGQ
jgi:membrane-bound lytic murein transglycosylase A